MPGSADVDDPDDLPTGILTFFFSDIEQSTRLASALGNGYASVLAEHRARVRSVFEANHGFEVSTGGDSFFAVFPMATDAIAAAVAIQAPPEAAADSGPASIRVRIGLHTGQAVKVGRDYVGLDVHVAARIGDAGHGGQLLVSDDVRAAVGSLQSPGFTLRDLGRHRLKDVGPQRLWQVEARGLQAGPFPALRSLEAHPTNLPGLTSALVDRERERDELAALIRESSIVTVTGPGGIGKSRLAISVARSIVDSFTDGVFHLDLEGSPNADAVAGSLVEVLGLRAGPGEPPRQILMGALRDRDLLLVLETADRVVDLADLVSNLAALCPRLRILVTSRSPLHVTSERELSLPPLPLEPAIELFTERARAVNASFVLNTDGRTAVRELVDRLDRIPLAIELAAARTKVFGPAALLDRLDRQLPALGEGARDVPSRQRTLRATIAWSCDLLPAREQSVFRQLAAFAGSFDLEAADGAVVLSAGGGNEDADVASVLEVLVDRSLITVESGHAGEPRFRLLAPIREFAGAALVADGLEDATRQRQARYWIAFAERQRQALNTAASDEAILALEVDEPNIRAALHWALEPIDAADRSPDVAATWARLGLELAWRMGRYWSFRGRVQEGVGWLEGALAAAPLEGATASGDPDLAQALFWAGVLLDDARRPGEAASRLEAALSLYRQVDDDVGIARALNSLGVVALSMGDLDRADGLFNESIERKRALADRQGVAVSLSNLGIVAGDRRRYAEAVEYMRQALEVDEAVGGGSIAVARVNLGIALIEADRVDDGLVALRGCIPGLVKLEDPELVADVLVSLTSVALGLGSDGDARRAARLLAASDALRERERQPLRDIDRREVDELWGALARRLDERVLIEARSEARAIDVPAALALVREVLG